MKLLIQFPTFARAGKFLKVLDMYIESSGDENDIFFNINCDKADSQMTNPHIEERINFILSKKPNISGMINYDWDTDKISAINDHVDERDFDIVICASDDMVPRINSWDQEIVDAMMEHFPSLDGCVHFNDGNTNGELITFSILGKKLYDDFGYIYHPDYKSLYCDAEFTEEVKRMERDKYIDKVIISHEHYSVDGTENHGDVDLAARKTLHFSGRDELVFNKRKELGFPKRRITED